MFVLSDFRSFVVGNRANDLAKKKENYYFCEGYKNNFKGTTFWYKKKIFYNLISRYAHLMPHPSKFWLNLCKICLLYRKPSANASVNIKFLYAVYVLQIKTTPFLVFIIMNFVVIKTEWRLQHKRSTSRLIT